MEDEIEVTYEPPRFMTKLGPDLKPDYSIDFNTRVERSPEWTELDRFIAEMRKHLIENYPRKVLNNKPTMPKNKYGRIRYGGSAFNPFGIGPKIIERGGSF